MSRTIDYYFSLASPWAYLGHAPFVEIARRHGAAINYKPVFLGRVFSETGGLPLPQRHPVRQRYRMLELQRWRERRGLPFKLSPKHWPFDVAPADRLVLAILVANGDPDPFMRRAFEAIWVEERNLGDRNVLAEIARDAGFDPHPLMKLADGTLTEAVYLLNQENAVAADVFGSPAYTLDGEVFWGQDRLDFLDDALASGRPPYRATVS
jgi:2-hydroxychromene-2-carboxylate isomerase